MFRRRPFSVFTLSFLDVMCCGFGAVVLLFLLLKHEAIVLEQVATVDLSVEVDELERQLAEARSELTAANDNATNVDRQIAALLAESASARELLAATAAEKNKHATAAPVTITRRDIEALKVALKKLASEKHQVMSQIAEQSRDVRQFLGEGNREYLTGIKTGGKRILILLDSSASMLDDTLVNVIRRRNMDDSAKRRSEKWQQALATVDWISARFPAGSQYQIYTFNGSAQPVVAGSEQRWLAVDDAGQLNRAIADLKQTVPAGGSNLARAMQVIGRLSPAPDNVFLITDGLPTMGLGGSRGGTVSGQARLRYFDEAVRQIPAGSPINVVLLPMEGDPMAPSAFWQIALITRGSFLTPAYDWP